MERSNLLLLMAVVAVGVALANTLIVLNKVNTLTGYATDTGYANLTVSENIQINFSTDTVNWGSGVVNVGENNATLDTKGPSTSRGNWSTDGVEPLVLENVGNINASLVFKAFQGANSDVSDFIGGTSPLYRWNFTNSEDNSCTFSGASEGTYYDANSSISVCSPFQFEDASDELRIDIFLSIPANSKTGALSDTIQAEASSMP